MDEIEIGEIIVDEELEIGEIELDAIKIEPETEQIEIIPTKEEQVKEGLFDKVIVQGYGNREIRKFNSIEEMNNTVEEEGELATVYYKGYKPVQQDSELRYVYFPKTVVLEESEKVVDISYVTPTGAYDETGKNIGGGSFVVHPTGGVFSFNSIHGYALVEYTSTDGITYTRTDTNEDVVDGLTEFIFTGTLKSMLQRFAFIPVKNYEGLYEYTNGTWNLIAPKGIIDITENGQYDVSDYAEANINVKGIDTSDATATADKILEGQTAYVNNEKVTGTMPNNGIITITPDIYEQIIEEGYIKGGTVQAVTSNIDSNIKAENIKKDVKILGVTGTLEESTGESSDIAITDASYLFYKGVRLDYMNEILALCRDVTSVAYMFYNCDSLTELDLSELDTSNVTDMKYVFYNCKKLTSLDLKNWDTSKVTDMSFMFYDCNFTVLDLSGFDTSNVTGMSSMFYNCSNLKSVSTLNTSNVTNMNSMFYECRKLETIPQQMDTSNVTNMNQTFYYCSVLKDVSQLDASKVNNIYNFVAYAREIVNFGGLKNLGKAYTQKSANYSNYRLYLSMQTKLTHESLMNIINGLYDLNLTYDVANGGTLYTQNLQLGSTNLAKLTEEEIAIATSKGWNVT